MRHWVWLLLPAAMLLAGCNVMSDERLRELAEENAAGATEYQVEAPDVLAIELRPNSELNTQVTINPDGYITLQYLDMVYIEGLTLVEIDQKLTDLYSQYLNQPEITVTLLSSRSKNIYVLGEVNRPGVVPVVGETTLMDVITFSGGLTRNAQPEIVKVVRMDEEEPKIYTLNMKQVVFEGKQLANFKLKPKDIVYVEPTVLAKTAYVIDSMLFPARALFLGIETSSSAKNTLRRYGREGLNR